MMRRYFSEIVKSALAIASRSEAIRLWRSSSWKGRSRSTKRSRVSSIFCIKGSTSRAVVSISASCCFRNSISVVCDCTWEASCSRYWRRLCASFRYWRYWRSMSRVSSLSLSIASCDAIDAASAATCSFTAGSIDFFSPSAPAPGAAMDASASAAASAREVEIAVVAMPPLERGSPSATRAECPVRGAASAPGVVGGASRLELLVDVLEPDLGLLARPARALRLREPAARLLQLLLVVVGDAEHQLDGAGIVETSLGEALAQHGDRLVPALVEHVDLSEVDVEVARRREIRRVRERLHRLGGLAREDPAEAQELERLGVVLEALLRHLLLEDLRGAVRDPPGQHELEQAEKRFQDDPKALELLS